RNVDLASIAETERNLLEYLTACAHGQTSPAGLTFRYKGAIAVYRGRGVAHRLSKGPAPRAVLLLLSRTDPVFGEPTTPGNMDDTQGGPTQASLRHYRDGAHA